MRLYIAGPITGTDDFQAAFSNAAKDLREAGYDVRNPAAISPDAAMEKRRPRDTSWQMWMRVTTAMLATCDGVALLPGWRASRGAMVEADWAEAIGLPVMEIDDWLEERRYA
ncbi:DUF4406 domain-containing protein [Actinomyces bowdenii]|uniref:DUF4406 domain-containing protein n=1 Tax=Actinomyces bowdenii TaxID=131109 RepID=UPI00214CED76|nr:DUF4406 domain-containing protein [Actinomyces bowdenii]MCR2051471.1 DUF4406 domain-containing protein [Actinomyces bowdenii]